MKGLLSSVPAMAIAMAAVTAGGIVGVKSALANDRLVALSQSDENWVMPGKNYASDNYSKLAQINAQNVKQLKPAWTFSTGVLNGHEGAPLIVNGKMYVNTPFPNTASRWILTIQEKYSGNTSPSKARRRGRSPAATSSTAASPIGPATRERRLWSFRPSSMVMS